MEMFKSEFLCMGTMVEQIIYDKNAYDIAVEVEDKIKNLERKMNFYSNDSEVTDLNTNGFNKFIKVSEDTFKVISEAKKISEITNGFFDISIGSVIKLWSVFSNNERVPKQNEVDRAILLNGYNQIILNHENNSIKFMDNNIKIDLGGIAKGYAADKAVDIYKKHKVKGAIINLGGNVSVYKPCSSKDYFIVGIQDPTKTRNNLIGAVYCRDESIVTSGNYERFFEKDGQRYGHIINTKTGCPTNNDLLSVTIIAKESILADGLATAIYAAGYLKGKELISKFEGVEAIFVTKDKKIYLTDNIRNRFVLIEDCGFSYA